MDQGWRILVKSLRNGSKFENSWFISGEMDQGWRILIKSWRNGSKFENSGSFLEKWIKVGGFWPSPGEMDQSLKILGSFPEKWIKVGGFWPSPGEMDQSLKILVHFRRNGSRLADFGQVLEKWIKV